MRVGGQRRAPAALPPGKSPGTHCTGGWVGPRAGLGGCEKSRLHRDSTPDRPTRSEMTDCSCIENNLMSSAN